MSNEKENVGIAEHRKGLLRELLVEIDLLERRVKAIDYVLDGDGGEGGKLKVLFSVLYHLILEDDEQRAEFLRLLKGLTLDYKSLLEIRLEDFKRFG